MHCGTNNIAGHCINTSYTGIHFNNQRSLVCCTHVSLQPWCESVIEDLESKSMEEG